MMAASRAVSGRRRTITSMAVLPLRMSSRWESVSSWKKPSFMAIIIM